LDTRPFLVISDLKGSLAVPADDTASDGRFEEYVAEANTWTETELTAVADGRQLDRNAYFWKKGRYAALAYARGLAFEHEGWTDRARAALERAQREMDSLKDSIRAARGGRQRLVGASRGLAEPQVLSPGQVSGYVTRAL